MPEEADPLTDETERKRLALLHRINLLEGAPDPVLDDIAALAATLTKTPIALVTLIDERTQHILARVGTPLTSMPREHSFCAHAIRQNQIMVVDDATADARFSDNPYVVGPLSIRFYAGAPLVVEPGFSVGALCVIDRQPRDGLSTEQAQALRHLSRLAVNYLITARRRANTDATTGLPNRRQLIEELDAWLASRSERDRISLVAIDTLDASEFNQLIRILGYARIDALLISIARILRLALPRQARLFHVGVLRFAFLFEGPADKAAELLADVVESLREPIVCGGIPIVTTACLGLAQCPEDSTRAIDLLRAGVAAAHDARRQRREWARYDNSSDQAAGRAFRILSDIRGALTAGGQFAVHYQPKVDLGTGRCVGAEALIRWRHPEFGWISPAEFIPLAEKTPLMRALTEHVLAMVCDQMLRWQSIGFEPKISVNVSVYDVEDRDFLRRVGLILARHGLRPGNLDFEMTESGVSANVEELREPLQKLRDMGVTISIDDFGTGQSALSYLRHIPADYLKIDQLFVHSLDRDIKDQILVRSTIELAHNLGLIPIAEGVATETSYRLLRRFGCDQAQGSYISQPLEPDAFSLWSRTRRLQTIG